MTPRDFWNIHTTKNSSRDTHLEHCSPYYREAHCNQKAPTHVFSRQQVRSKKPKKVKASTLITNTSRIYLFKSI